MSRIFFLSMCDVKIFLTFTSPNMVLLWQLFYLFCSSIVINTDIVTAEPLSRNESGRFGALRSDSTHHFFRNACTKSGSLRFSVFRLLTDFVWLYTYEFWLSLCKIVRSSVILLLPLFVTFHLDIVLSVLLRFTDSYYPFGIFKLFDLMNLILELYSEI